jgi:D-proline dehydrogenase
MGDVKAAVVGGGVVGLFAAYYLDRAGADVSILETGAPGARSAHAAGIIEPANAYRTNTFAFLRRVWRLWRNGTCTFSSLDARWLTETVRVLERAPLPGADGVLQEMAATSVAAYDALAAEHDDFAYAKQGLLEIYDEPRHFREERSFAESRNAVEPVEARESAGGAGGLFFPHVGWLDTDRFVRRMLRELARVRIVRQKVDRVDLDGTVSSGGSAARFDAVVVCTGVSSRKLGVPLTGVKGYGWHVRTPARVETATIYADRGIAIVPLPDGFKATGGWDFDLSASSRGSARVLEAVRRTVPLEEVVDYADGIRPCTPDGLPTVGRRHRLTIANGGFRLGWSFAPAMGRHAARLALALEENDPFLSRFCGGLHGGPL